MRIDDLKIDRTTSPDGAYSFVVPSASVRGQTVTIVVSGDTRRGRFAPASEKIALVGGALVKDFNLTPLGPDDVPVATAQASPPNDVTTMYQGRTE